MQTAEDKTVEAGESVVASDEWRLVEDAVRERQVRERGMA